MSKRIFAIIGIVVLVLMYASTIVAALIDNPYTMNFLGASIGATVMIPIVLWVGILFFKGRKDNKQALEEMKQESKKNQE